MNQPKICPASLLVHTYSTYLSLLTRVGIYLHRLTTVGYGLLRSSAGSLLKPHQRGMNHMNEQQTAKQQNIKKWHQQQWCTPKRHERTTKHQKVTPTTMVHIQEPTSIHHFLEFADRVATDALTHARDFQFPRHNIPPASEFRVNSVEGAFIGIVPLLKKAFFVFGTGVILLCVSLAAYGLFYLAVMPSHHATEPLFFDYSGISKHPAPVCVDDNLERTDHQLLPRHLKSTPWAVADLFSKQTQWEAYSKDVVPNPITDTRILKERSAYYIDIVLDLPESDVNRMSGMFGVLVELQSSNGRKLAHSVRAARLPHESSWISSMRKFILLVPLMIGAIQENRRVIVPSFRHYVESSESPLVRQPLRSCQLPLQILQNSQHLSLSKSNMSR